jgi:class 3 adenylate cyclase
MTAGLSQPEARKVVTVLFSDICGSTGLGQALDPEALQQLLSRYFAEMKLIVERHEGLVSKFIGDAVMAVFGLPRVHEDDALRAVRAAADMRETLAELNGEFASSWGVTVGVRIGVNTGEVLAREPRDGQSLVVGDAVNPAARLEQVAEAGEILIGEDTYRLVHDAVTAEQAGPLRLRGKADSVSAWRLLGVAADAPGWSRRLDSPLVGRERELAELEAAFMRAVEADRCELVTVMGPAGVGKSRLTGELVVRLGSRAAVLRGRCLSYGEGITFWPVASVLTGAAGLAEHAPESEARRTLSTLVAGNGDAGQPDADLVCDALTPLLGYAGESVGIQETYRALRTILECLGRRRPVVVVFDDIHWGEPTFLDLLEYLADWIRSAAVLLVCQARPELLDFRPGWMAAKENASLLTLKPLSAAQTEALIRGLVGGMRLPPEAHARIAAMAEGNPLFVEETLRMLVDHGVLRSVAGRWTVTGDLSAIAIPPTIHALLTARLDHLDPDQRAVIERGSVVGRTFWWGAVSALAPDEVRPRVGTCLQALVRKGLIEPGRSEIRHEDAFRFSHILVQDAAYQGIPKAARAEMHAHLADWIDVEAQDLPGGFEEIVGYHLEQAHRCLVELGPPTGQTAALAARAADLLSTTGQRAFARGDMPAAVNLLTRATALLPSRDTRRLDLLPDLAFALMETADFDGLVDIARDLHAAATEAGDARRQAHAIVVELWTHLFTDPGGWITDAEQEATRAIATFDRFGDERGLARAWSLLGWVHGIYTRSVPGEQAWSKAAEHALRAGNRRDALESLSWVPLYVWAGPTPAEEGIRLCREVFEQAQGDKKAMSNALVSQAGLEAGLGQFDEARQLVARARALLEDIALPVWIGTLSQFAAWTELLAGDPAAAERELRRGCETLSAVGERSFFSTVAGILAEAIYAQRRYREARHFTRVSEEAAGPVDVYSHLMWRSVRAKCLARQGQISDGMHLARATATLAETTDFAHLRWYELMSRAEVLGLAHQTDEAKAALHEAIRIAEQKRNLVGARLGREALQALSAPR